MGLGFVPLKQAVNELKTIQCWTDILAEFYMNFIILFVTIGVAIHVSNVPSQYGMLALAITGGWYVYVSIESWAAVNGAHINPCITVLFICTKRVSFIKGLFYIPSQLAGGTAGVWFLKQCIPDSDVQFIAPLQLHPNITQLQGVGIEWVITSGLMTCALGVLDDRMRELNMPGLTVGTAIMIGILVAGPYTGGCMNPNIAFAPAAVTNKWKDHWVYWVGPMLGVATALVAYYLLSWQRQLIKKKEKEEFSLSMLPKLTLSATTGLVQDTKKINDGSPKNTDVLLGDQEDKNISEYKGFFIKQKPTDAGNKNESSIDDTPTQKGFYKKPANIHHRF